MARRFSLPVALFTLLLIKIKQYQGDGKLLIFKVVLLTTSADLFLRFNAV
jgi:hypothetical protein